MAVDNCAQERYSLAGLQYALGKIPWAESICFNVIILNNLFTRAWFRSLRSGIGRRHHLFWGQGSSFCRSLTRSGLEGRFPWLLFPADTSPLHGELDHPRCPLCWRAHHGSVVVFERKQCIILLYKSEMWQWSGRLYSQRLCSFWRAA